MVRNPNNATLPGFAGVSYRCLAILDDLADGLSMAQSAKRNGWPTTSVVQSVIRMKARIGVRSEAELVNQYLLWVEG